MAKWFRSEPMEYISLIMNEDAAHDCLADLGKMGILQFTDVSMVSILKLSICLPENRMTVLSKQHLDQVTKRGYFI